MPHPDNNQQNSQKPPLTEKKKKLERNLSDKNRSMSFTSKSQPNLENKSMTLPSKTKQVSEDPPLPHNKKN